jgi:hypothetical protein
MSPPLNPPMSVVHHGIPDRPGGAADAVREAGRNVPDDVALVGFDNWDVMAEACRPPLTTVDMNLRDLQHAAHNRNDSPHRSDNGRRSTGDAGAASGALTCLFK